ncbi:MAG TPA: hypothetical protein VMG11_09330 [Steroidobacteraceae bacterium]|nr:hypothetical protein [Steroidobacteraceae bacterium]
MALGKKTGGGSRKGIPNKATSKTRDLITAFVDSNAEKVQELWDKVAQNEPARALELYAKITEFALPKLSRSTIDGELGVRGRLVINE